MIQFELDVSQLSEVVVQCIPPQTSHYFYKNQMVIYFDQVSAEHISCSVGNKEIKIQVEDIPAQVPDITIYRTKGTILELPIPRGARCHVQGRELTSVESSTCKVDLSILTDVRVDVFFAVGTSTQLLQQITVAQIPEI